MIELHPYWPLRDGSWIKYQVFDIEAEVDLVSGYSGISKRTAHANSPQVMTAKWIGNMHAVMNHLPGEVPVPGLGTIYNARRGDKVGEIAGPNIAQLPKINLLTDVPIEGEKFVSNSDIIHYKDGLPFLYGQFDYQRFTHHVGKRWDAWPDTIRTALIENKPPAPYVHISYRGQLESTKECRREMGGATVLCY
jgi:hypothetical protein